MKTKHIPLRRCAACGTQAPKHELLRVVRQPDGTVIIDPRGKQSGRGAYVCKKAECWEKAFAKGRLETVLKQPLSKDQRDALRKEVAILAAAKS